MNLFLVYKTAKRLAQPAMRKGRPRKGVNKFGSFFLNNYLAKGR